MQLNVMMVLRGKQISSLVLKQRGHSKKAHYSYRVQDEDASFALRGDEEAKQSLVALAVMIQIHVANTP